MKIVAIVLGDNCELLELVLHGYCEPVGNFELTFIGSLKQLKSRCISPRLRIQALLGREGLYTWLFTHLCVQCLKRLLDRKRLQTGNQKNIASCNFFRKFTHRCGGNGIPADITICNDVSLFTPGKKTFEIFLLH